LITLLKRLQTTLQFQFGCAAGQAEAAPPVALFLPPFTLSQQTNAIQLNSQL